MTHDFTDHKFKQDTLFGDKKLNQNFRHSDPPSSKLAGETIHRSGKSNSQRHVLEYLVRKYPGKTSKELESLAIQKEPLLLRLTHTQIGKRVHEMDLVVYDTSVIKLDNCHPINLKD